MPMRAGKLRNRVTVHTRGADARDTAGGFTPGSAGSNRYAAIYDLSGRELERAKQAVAEATHRIELRFFDGLAPEDWIVFGSEEFEILSVADPGRRGEKSIVLAKRKA